MRDGALLDQLAECVRGRRNAPVTGRPALTRDMLVATLGDLVPASECTVWLDDSGGDSPPAAARPRGFGVRTSALPSTLGSPGSLLSRLLAEAARLTAARAVAIELDSETGGGSARRRRRPRLDALGGCADSAIGASSCREPAVLPALGPAHRSPAMAVSPGQVVPLPPASGENEPAIGTACGHGQRQPVRGPKGRGADSKI